MNSVDHFTLCLVLYYRQIVKNLGVVTKGLDRAMASMNLEEVEKIMQKFETQFEDLDVRESVSDTHEYNTNTSTPFFPE